MHASMGQFLDRGGHEIAGDTTKTMENAVALERGLDYGGIRNRCWRETVDQGLIVQLVG